MKIRFERRKDRLAEPFNTWLVLMALTLALVNCFLFLRTTGPPGLERALPTIGLVWFSLQALGWLWILARQLMREKTLKPVNEPGAGGLAVTLGDSLVILGIVGEVLGIVLLIDGTLGTLR
ncbi:MAG TPA: hypothetical protein VKF82_11985 [Candidatus Eremiobacteraceae bacterium]|nr:hypothetical protein [Candidatus Eremiobacteraceae bacterium]